MKSPKSVRLPMDFHRQPGFALVVAMSLMAFILMLVLGLSTLTQIELAAASTSQQKEIARENARLGLLVALGKLQAAAGPDQRVTARAEILGDAVTGGSRYWTGVWTLENAKDFSGSPTVKWMVSGHVAPADATNPVDANGRSSDPNYVVLFGPASVSANESPENEFIAVPKEDVEGGRFAYWIGDEGVKADFGVFEDDIEDVTLKPFHNDAGHQALAQQLGSFSYEDLFADPEFDRFDHDLESKIEHIVTMGTALSIDLPDVETYRDTLMENAHSLTSENRFVIADTLNGGLRKDLSHLKSYAMTTADLQAKLQAEYETPLNWPYITPELARFMQYHKTASATVTPDVPDNYMTEELTFGTQPVVVELAFRAVLGSPSSTGPLSGDLILIYYVFADVLNPYTTVMDLDNGNGSHPGDPTDIDFKITGLPEVTIRNLTKSRTDKIKLPEISGGVNSYYNHDPGYQRANSYPTGSYRTPIPGITTNSKGVIPIKIGTLGYTPDINDKFIVEFDTSTVVVEYLESKTNKNEPRTFQRITIDNWGGFEIEYEGTGIDSRFVHTASKMTRSDWVNKDDWTFSLHTKFADDWVETFARDGTLQPLDDVLTIGDIRKREIMIDMLDPLAGDGQFFAVSIPDEVDRTGVMTTNDFFQGDDYAPIDHRLARLYDLPVHEPMSLSAFNMMLFPNGKPRPLGNYFNDEASGNLSDYNTDGDYDDPDESLNNFFDGYYFSGLPTVIDDWDQNTPLPNSRLIKIRRVLDKNKLASSDTATQFLMRAGFNINSQSAESWRALLQGRPVNKFKYTNNFNHATTINELERTVFNHTFSPGSHLTENSSGAKISYIPSNEASRLSNNIINDGSHEAFTQGFRSLSNADVQNLATALVAKHKEWTEAKGRPFESVTEFINSGIMQSAIDEVPNINTPGNKRIPNLAPAHVNAGGLLGQHSNALFARSDTFVIRSYGEVLNPYTKDVSASAFCEALVQRMPGDDMDAKSREFKIIGFRWLSESEI